MAYNSVDGYNANPASPFPTTEYNTALSLSMKFYYAQYSGDLWNDFPIAWRGDSALNDGNDVGVDLTGGWYDAGDHIKFAFPMAQATTALAWGALVYSDGYEASDSYDDVVIHLDWVTDYLLRAYCDNDTASLADDVFYAVVGDPDYDHDNELGPAEMMTDSSDVRPAYAVTAEAPGSEVTAETAAAMAATSLVMRANGNTEKADLLLQQAIKLFAFAETYQGHYQDTVDVVNDFYPSSGFSDELAWAACWLHKATGEQSYLTKAEDYYTTPWSLFSWDDKSAGVSALLADLTGKTVYTDDLEAHIVRWAEQSRTTDGTLTNDGLAFDEDLIWGTNRYSANTAFIALQYAAVLESADPVANEQKIQHLYDLARDQIDYMLGDNANLQSYLIGFGSKYPLNPAHGGSTGTRDFSMQENNLYELTGALVGGPDQINGNYNDTRADYITNEVTVDYNALFSGVLAGFASRETIVSGSSGNDTLTGDAGKNRLEGLEGNDILDGGAGDDDLQGGEGNDILTGGAGADALNGGADFDTASYAGAGSAVYVDLTLNFGGGSGDSLGDTFTSIEKLIGSDHGDTLVGDHAVLNTLIGGDGNDFLYGVGLDTVDGGAGIDVFFGGYGGAININMNATSIETVWGSVVGDNFNGASSSANLVMIGQGGADTMTGGSGNDFFYFDNLDTVVGGGGSDWAVAALSTAGVTLDLNAAGIENAWGSDHDDTLTAAGATTSVVMVGGAGNDSLTGGDADDFLYGFGDGDTIKGGLGNDALSSGLGSDTFIFDSANWGVDTIWDFTSGQDTINMAGSGYTDFNQLTINTFGAHSAIVSGSDAIWVLNDTTLDASDFAFV
ncbi:MAG: hypothetical protein GY742_18605 [Hyphomicrobiales bacterium]|nr:hypothetical protein [Hyphomicrobiales bacterium]